MDSHEFRTISHGGWRALRQLAESARSPERAERVEGEDARLAEAFGEALVGRAGATRQDPHRLEVRNL